MVKEWIDGGGARLPYSCSKLNDEVGDDLSLVHLPSSIQRSKDCVTHGNSYPVWLFRIQNGDKKCEHPPMSRIRAVLDGVPILGTRQLLETVLDVLVLPACQSATARAEVVDFSPAFFRPPGWCRSDGVVKLVRHPVQQLPHNPVVLETPRLLEQSGTTHCLEIF
jgi:hypothetical protein